MSQIPDPSQVPPSGNAPPPGGAPAPLNYGTPGGYGGPPPTKDEQTQAMLCYILGIFGVFGWIGPLIIWMTKKDSSPFISDQGKEVLNWELTVIPAYIICMPLMCIPLINILGILIIIGIGITNLIFCILGAVKANQGIAYRMPFSFKYIK